MVIYFSRFYQWFIKLCEFSLKTNDIWLVKNHPDFGEEYSQYVKYRDVTKHALKNFPNIKLLDKKTTLNDLKHQCGCCVYSKRYDWF